MKLSNLLYIMLLPLVLFSITNLYAADTYSAALPALTAPPFLMQRHKEEWFAAGTLVCVQD